MQTTPHNAGEVRQRATFRSMSRSRQVVWVLFFFTVLGIARHLHQFGEDLGSSYLGCRLLATGHGDRLYTHNPIDFAQVNDPVWSAVAVETGFFPLRMIHPYVQTPLWAWSLQPLCMHMRYRAFCNSYIVIFMLCMSATLWLVARYWTPGLMYPGWIALIYFCFYISEPFKYAIFLGQTHILYLVMSIAAILLAQRRWPVTAGVLLALAAAVKITPGLLLIYWLLTRRYKAALAFVLSFAALTALTVLLLGTGLMRDYLQSLAYNSNVLLLAFNNQSFAAFWTHLSASKWELLHWFSYRLPTDLKWASTLLTLASAVAGGLLDRRAEERSPTHRPATPPYGAVLTLVAATLFAPIAWIHYFIVLILPAMLLLERWKVGGSRIWVLYVVTLLVLNLYPISIGTVHVYYKGVTLFCSQFLSGLLALIGMAALGVERLQRAPAAPVRVLASA